MFDEIDDPIDRMVAHAVYARGIPLQGSGRTMMTWEKAQQIYDGIKADLAVVESAIGRPLPHSRERLSAIAADRWAGVSP